MEKSENIEKLKKKVDKEIERLIIKGYMLARDNGSDVFGFGLSLYRNSPSIYKSIDWYEEFAKIEPDVEVDITIKSSGTIQQSIERISNE